MVNQVMGAKSVNVFKMKCGLGLGLGVLISSAIKHGHNLWGNRGLNSVPRYLLTLL